MLELYILKAEACAATGCKLCRREAERYRQELATLDRERAAAIERGDVCLRQLP